MYLFFDTETTGFINKNLSPTDPKQARICQLAAILMDEQAVIKAQMDVLIQPTNWTISQRLTDIHGISHADAVKYGVPIEDALTIFERFVNKCDLLCAHNFDFDRNMVDLEHKAAQVEDSQFSTKSSICTMLNSVEVCKIPHPSRGGFKWPKLQEAHLHLFGKEFEEAHDAFVDVKACARVFFELRRLENL